MAESSVTGPLLAFGSWAARAGGFSAVARRLATDAVVDTLGCMVAGQGDLAVTGLRAALVPAAEQAGEAALVGGGRASASVAALVNGTAAHALDYDDNFRPGRCHASAVLVPSLLALVEREHASGFALIDAYIVGLEAQAFVGHGMGEGHYVAGWHPTGTVAAIGTAAGAARLMGLEAAGTAAAMSNAVSMAAGLKVQFGTAMKPVHAGLAARAAVEAALLARAGISGRADVLDHDAGFRALYAGDGPGWPDDGAIGAPLSIESDGVVPKLYPCCGSTHYVLDMIRDLRRTYGFAAGDVLSVEATVGPANFDNLPYPDPRDGMQARFSLPYCVALALGQDRLTLADFTDAAVLRPEIRRLLPLTRMVRGEVMAPAVPHTVTVRLGNGRILTAERREVRGSLSDPFDLGEMADKFRSCLGIAGFTPGEAARLDAALRAIDGVPLAAPLIAPLFSPAGAFA